MPDRPSPFDLLGLTPGFLLDRADIRRRFLAQTALIHPDLADPGSADDAARQSARLNEARQTLDDPERRAIALLAELGGATASQDRSLPDGFLIEIMETREAVEADRGDPARLEYWQAWAEQQRQDAINDIERAFAALESPPTPESLAGIRQRLNAWRYFERLIEQLDPDYDPNRADFSS